VRRPVGVVSALVLTAIAAAGCTAVPTDSRPEVVESLPAQIEAPHPEISPPPGADPRTIVEDFLQANALGDPHHNAARSFLTTEAKNRWSDTTVTVVDNPFVGNVDSKNMIAVTGPEIGTIDASGVYTPALSGDGSGAGGVAVSPSFRLKRVRGQWRIDSLQNGLVVSAAQFQTQSFEQRSLYYFDQSGTRLVPDPRWTQLGSGVALADWLMTRLADGPRGSLQTMLPGQADPKRETVSMRDDGVTVVEIPGAGQLGEASRDRLAAQIGMTLAQVPQVSTVEIVDAQRPVRIPEAGSAVFDAVDVTARYQPSPTAAGLYYVRSGGVYDESGTALPGKVGSGMYRLTSVAMGTRPLTATLSVAGTRGTGGAQRLLIGSDRGLSPTALQGRLSRPAWDTAHDEVWIGDGTGLYRVTPAGVVKRVQVTAASGSATGRVTAVRLSPEGARVALVLTDSDGSAQLWVGSIVRTSSAVRVDALTPISPQGVAVSDVAWNDELKLFAIGRDLRSGFPGVYEVQVDGSRWTDRGTVGLPQAPDSITVAEGEVAAVSAGITVWKQRAGSWVSLLRQQTVGTNPVYVE
jgi:Lipoprotein LpqB beta-propeller domain/Sporulation and spore germination